jgi:hypothetical protein
MVLKIIELPENIPANNFPENELLIQRHAHAQIDPICDLYAGGENFILQAAEQSDIQCALRRLVSQGCE